MKYVLKKKKYVNESEKEAMLLIQVMAEVIKKHKGLVDLQVALGPHARNGDLIKNDPRSRNHFKSCIDLLLICS